MPRKWAHALGSALQGPGAGAALSKCRGGAHPVKVVEGGPELIHLLLADALGVPGQDLVLHLVDGPGDGGEELLPAHTDMLQAGKVRQQRDPRTGPGRPSLLPPLTIKMTSAIKPGLLPRLTESPGTGKPRQGQQTRTEDPEDEEGSTEGDGFCLEQQRPE